MPVVKTDTWEAWFSFAIAVMLCHGIKVIFEHGARSSEFDGTKKFLRVNYDPDSEDPDYWKTLFIHEYNHYLQWHNGSENWADEACYDRIFADIAGASPEDLQLATNCELECEHASLKVVKALFPHKAEDYCKAANAYLTFWHYLPTFGAWYTKPPYAIQEILDAMPGDKIRIVVDEDVRNLIERLAVESDEA